MLNMYVATARRIHTSIMSDALPIPSIWSTNLQKVKAAIPDSNIFKTIVADLLVLHKKYIESIIGVVEMATAETNPKAPCTTA